jgi:hypothetical protein
MDNALASYRSCLRRSQDAVVKCQVLFFSASLNHLLHISGRPFMHASILGLATTFQFAVGAAGHGNPERGSESMLVAHGASPVASLTLSRL